MASCLATTLPSVTCPSPPRATWLPRRTLRIVVDLAGFMVARYPHSPGRAIQPRRRRHRDLFLSHRIADRAVDIAVGDSDRLAKARGGASRHPILHRCEPDSILAGGGESDVHASHPTEYCRDDRRLAKHSGRVVLRSK